jgi:hypothetical protein
LKVGYQCLFEPLITSVATVISIAPTFAVLLIASSVRVFIALAIIFTFVTLTPTITTIITSSIVLLLTLVILIFSLP